MKKTVVLPFLLTFFIVLAAGPLQAVESRKPKVAVALSFESHERWPRDLRAMRGLADKMGIELLVEVARNNQMQQNHQVNKLLDKKPSVLILSPHDTVGAAAIVKKAHDQGIKVICYDRLVMNSGVDVFVGYDHREAGRQQAGYLAKAAPQGDYIVLSGSPGDYNSLLLRQGALSALEPLIKSGRVTVAADEPVINWSSGEARAIVAELLNDGLKPAAVLAQNDSLAAGAIEALNNHGFSGRVLVTGMDAQLEAVKRLITGAQSMTIFKDPYPPITKAFEIASKLASGETVESEINGEIFDGSRMVPAVMFKPVTLTSANLNQIIIGGGFWSLEEVYGNYEKFKLFDQNKFKNEPTF